MTAANQRRALRIAIDYVKQAQAILMEALLTQRYHVDAIFAARSDAGDTNPSFGFDETSNQILFEILNREDFACRIYSEEEHAWKTVGTDPAYYVVCDPFCNSFLASKSFRDAAVAICICDLDGQFSACAIGDLQIERIYYADPSGAYVLEDYRHGNAKVSPIHVSATKRIEESFVVLPLLKPSRRAELSDLPLFRRAKVVHGVDGAIMIARLAAGYVDAYLDPTKGQPLYEIPCCEIIARAGGTVSDERGNPFRLDEIIGALGKDPAGRYKLIAACTEELHKSLLTEVMDVRH